jgi:hypothetical protein
MKRKGMTLKQLKKAIKQLESNKEDNIVVIDGVKYYEFKFKQEVLCSKHSSL